MPRKKQSGSASAQAKATSGAKAPHGSKSAFVRALPLELSAKEVVAKAKAAGLQLSIAQVYSIRSTSKRKGTVERTPKPGARRTASSSTESLSSDADARLRRLIAEVGLSRSREVLAEVSAAFAG